MIEYKDKMELNPEDYRVRMDSLRNEFGKNKTIPPDIEMQVLASLSFFPEFKELNIDFRYRKISTTMASLPAFAGVFRNADKKKYLIIINHQSEQTNTISLMDVPFNAQLGLIGHELAHIQDYLTKNSFSLLITGLMYLFRSFRRKYEKQTDMVTIQHGLGWQLYDYTYFVMHSPIVSDRYKKQIQKYYLGPEEIFNIIKH